ncbi:integrase core domain-containing protein [Microcella alkaliphila]|uniref:integrase core domain-containing protein n=1 Tax=Microcella alkaliphila TaxID=279828 RepID=UPI001E2F8FC4|nr:transposase [Microcella alkaliphila]
MQGITQKNGRPYKPTTQGKIERFWQTLKKCLTMRPANSLEDLQSELDDFVDHYNNNRPHRALNRRTPAFAYGLIPKAAPTRPDDPNIWRVRYDTIDAHGKVALRPIRQPDDAFGIRARPGPHRRDRPDPRPLCHHHHP